jgi:hypothetical protein
MDGIILDIYGHVSADGALDDEGWAGSAARVKKVALF